MRCRDRENDIALYVESDLVVSRSRELEMHLDSCGVCRTLVQDLRATQRLFKGLRQETVTDAALAQLRMSVTSRVERRQVRVPWGRWIYAVAGSAFVLLLGLAVASLHRPVVVKHAVETGALPPVAAPPLFKVENKNDEVPHAAGESRRRRQGGRHSETLVEPPLKQVTVKLLTDDPNIVIYWLVDTKGGEL